METSEDKAASVNIVLDPDIYKALKARSVADDRSMAGSVRRAIRLYLDSEDEA